jgi:superfamily II DNA or RNA helicase
MKTIKTVISNYIWPKNIPADLSKKLKKEVSIPNPEYENAKKFKRRTYGIPKFLRPYVEERGELGLPRGYFNRYLNTLAEAGFKAELEWKTSLYEKKKLKGINLRDYQKPWVDTMLSEFQGVGQAPCGAGKTVCGIEIYLKLGQPCLWLTHTDGLAKQVAKELLEFTGETAGIIGAGKEDIRHFTIGLVPTLCRRDLEKYKDLFGLIIVDECHHIPATTFTKVISAFTAHYRYGVTATPYRDDGLEPLLFQSVGPIVTSISKQYLRDIGMLMAPTIIRRPTEFTFPYNSSIKSRNYMALKKALGQNQKRNEQIATDVIVESTIDNNTCIVLVGTIDHGKEMFNILSDIITNTGLVHSKLKMKERDEVMEAFGRGELDILVATYKMLAEGFDYKPSNRLFLTAPFKGRILIEQACGRIERIHPGKTDAIAYDYVDENIGVLSNQAGARQDVYEANNNHVITIR